MEQRQYGDWSQRGELMNKVNEMIGAVALGNVDHVKHVGAHVLALALDGAIFVRGDDPLPDLAAALADGAPEIIAAEPASAQTLDEDDEDEDDDEDEKLLREIGKLGVSYPKAIWEDIYVPGRPYK